MIQDVQVLRIYCYCSLWQLSCLWAVSVTEHGCIFKGKSSHLWLEQETQLALNIGKVDLIRFIGMQTNITAAIFSRKCLKAVCASLNNSAIVGKYFVLGAVAILQKHDADPRLLFIYLFWQVKSFKNVFKSFFLLFFLTTGLIPNWILNKW